MIFDAGGNLAAPIFILADKNIDKNTIDVQIVTVLGIGVEPNSIGNVVFCKSRISYHFYYEWLISIISPR